MTVQLASDPVTRAAADWLRARLAPGARLTADSRRVRAGDAFFAWPGGAVDGRRYCAAAKAAGAAALLVEADGWAAFDDPVSRGEGAATDDAAGATLAISNLRERAGPIASAGLDEPSARLTVVAVTGTNGKTSCTQWIAAGFNEAVPATTAPRAVVIGTLGEGAPGRLRTSTALTTPDALDLQQSLARFVADGVELVAIEASSIGLVQHRLDGTRIAVAVMTNLTRDHLDVHLTMSAYATAKARLFDWPGLAAAVVNLDDPAAAAMLERVAPGTRRIGYSLSAVPASHAAAETLVAGEPGPDGAFVLDIAGTRTAVRLQLLGAFNRSNALAVAGVWHALGWTPAAIVRGLERLQPVPGRLQRIGDPADLARPLVVIDYAHTPDALTHVLSALAPVAAARGGRLWCVFGAGGDRDRGKRAPMSAAVERVADVIVLTSDNPRSEAPRRILADLQAGLERPAHLVEVDRARAIEQAMTAAAATDVVLIAGKGHEDYQEIAGVRHPFSDVEVASAVRSRLGEAGGMGDGDIGDGGIGRGARA